jgi:hypothetical protein
MVTVNLNLDKKTERLFQELEKNSGINKEKFIASLVNGKENLEDLKTVNKLLKEEKTNPNPKVYTHEELGKRLGF